MRFSNNFLLVLTFLFALSFTARAQFIGPAPLVVPGNNYAFAYSSNGTIGGLSTFGLYFNESSTTTPGYEFKGSGGAKLVTIQSVTKGNREPGDITFGNTGSLIINPNRYAFRFSLTNSYGLFFNATGLAYEFRTADASPVFSIGANSGDIIADGSATFGSIPQDNSLNEVLVKDANGLVHYRDAATLGGGGGLWSANGSNVYYNGGNVGVGTTSPSDKLTVNGQTNSSSFKSGDVVINGVSSTATIDVVKPCYSAGGAFIKGDVWACNNSFDWIRFQRGSTGIKFRVSQEGNGYFAGSVGIGSNTPVSKLSLHTGTGYGLIHTDGVVEVGTYVSGFGGWFGTRNNYDLFLFTNNSIPQVTLQKGTGNLGIGTLNPSTKLTVKGEITCSELTVVDISSIPDYVFKDDYNLMSLEEVSRFIDDNGHLPNIPNEKQVRSEGVKIGELNMKLLEKIEELTLHMIEKDQQIIEIQKQLVELKEGNH